LLDVAISLSLSPPTLQANYHGLLSPTKIIRSFYTQNVTKKLIFVHGSRINPQ